jgi:hypothetical protein
MTEQAIYADFVAASVPVNVPEISVLVLACRQAVVERGQDRLRLFKLKTDLERLFLADRSSARSP